jgi:hypothetical protein
LNEDKKEVCEGKNKNVPIIVWSSSENKKQFPPLSLPEHESWNDFILSSENFQHLLKDGECPIMSSSSIIIHVHFYNCFQFTIFVLNEWAFGVLWVNGNRMCASNHKFVCSMF